MNHKNSHLHHHPSFRPNKLSYAISAVLAAPASAAVAQDQDQTDDAGAGMLEEVLVTARKRTESVMDIPESIQALSGAELTVAGLNSMDDYVRFIPSMSYVSSNPGSATLVFRGIADSGESFIAEPTAALYLDEQSLTLNSTPDPRMVDIERIEALSGPQGTLYGANAQSGLLRVITNKPTTDGFEAFVDVMGRNGSDADMSYDVSAMVNLPISDTFALRLVGYTAEDGGFIDNVNGDSVPYGIFNNAGSEVENFNDVKYHGGRIAARWFANDNWTITANIVHQDTYSDGRPERDPTLAEDLAISRFRVDKEYDDTDWTQYGLTIEGDLGFAEFVSATSYFTRDWTYTQDTQPYAAYFGTFCYDGYYAAYSNYSPYCFQPVGVGNYYNDPVGYLINVQKDTKFAQEFRLSHTGERFDWVAGIFYEEAEQDWEFQSFETGYGFRNSKSFANYRAGRVSGYPAYTGPDNDAWWLSADSTDWKQWAVFGEFTYHLTERWDLTAGGRWFDREIDKSYYVQQPAGNVSEGGTAILPASDSDFLPKFSVSFQANENSLLYALYSEGFRPGGTNRTRGQTFFPTEFDGDLLENFEIGGKFTLGGGRARLNVTYFDMSWNDYQLEIIDPSNRPCGTPGSLPEPTCGQPWQKVVGNVGDASSSGFEVQFDAAATENLTVGANATWLDAEVDDGFEFLIPVPAGSRLPLSPEFKASAYMQYGQPADWFGGAVTDWYARLQWSYTGDMLNQVEPFECCDFDNPNYGPAPQVLQPSYNIGDFRFGIEGLSWTLAFFVNNITDERAVLYENTFELDYFFGKGRQTVNRPREYGVRFIKRFGN